MQEEYRIIDVECSRLNQHYISMERKRLGLIFGREGEKIEVRNPGLKSQVVMNNSGYITNVFCLQKNNDDCTKSCRIKQNKCILM